MTVFCNDLVNDSVLFIDPINAYFMFLYDLHDLVLIFGIYLHMKFITC